MAFPYSLDLWQKIFQAHERGMDSQREIAEFFGVSLSFVEKLLLRVHLTGNAATIKQGHGPGTRLNDTAQAHVRLLAERHSDITLAEMVD